MSQCAPIELFLHPGDWQFADRNYRLRTTLGSCVSIVLWHPLRLLGGMTHCLLPSRSRPSAERSGKYVDESMELLFGEIARHNTQARDYQVKLFGGGCMMSDQGAGFDVAARNVEALRRVVTAAGLRVHAESLGGWGYRKLLFDIAKGDVWLSRGGAKLPGGKIA